MDTTALIRLRAYLNLPGVHFWKTVLTLLVLGGVLSANESANAMQLAITNVDVVDTESGVLQVDQTVVIESGRVTMLGGSDTIEAPAQSTVIDGQGKFLIPGLWDMHVHLPWLANELTMPLFIANGVTGVREMGGGMPYEQKLEWQQQIAEGTLLGPRIMSLSHSVVNTLSSNEEAREMVDANPDPTGMIKVYHQVLPEYYLTLMEAAHQKGVAVAGHRPQSVSAVDASKAGQKSFEHARLFLYESYPGALALRARYLARYSGEDTSRDRIVTTKERREMLDGFDPKLFDEVVTAMIENETWFCPTHLTRKMDAFADNEAYRNDTRLKYISPLQRVGWDRDADGMVRQDPSEEGRTAFMAFYQKGLELTGQAHRAGVKIIAGTDANDTYVFPGFSLHDELQELVVAGLSPIEALQTATINPAEYYNATDEYGSIAVGKVADMILLDANPLSDISNTKQINTLIFRGEVHEREALDLLLEGVEGRWE